MSDATRRAIRTFLQVVLAAVAGVPAAVGAFDLPASTVAKVTGLLAVLVPLVTYTVNALEERGTLPDVLKKPPTRD